MPRRLDDGTLNRYWIVRLKDKLGTRSMASGEIKLEGALAYHVGRLDRGFVQMADMVNWSRLSNGVKSTALMRRAMHDALAVAFGRIAFGRRIVEHPLARRQLLKMMLPLEQALSLSFVAADALERAERGGSQEAAALVRILTPVLKYRATRDARKVCGDALEMRGGVGYVEEFATARLLRDAHLGSIWEGTGNIIALDALRRAVGRHGTEAALADDLHARIEEATSVPIIYRDRLKRIADRAVAFARSVAANADMEADSRQATSVLYHAASAVSLAWEANLTHERRGDARRLLLSRLVLDHRLASTDPFAAAAGAIENRIADLLLSDRPVPMDEAAEPRDRMSAAATTPHLGAESETLALLRHSVAGLARFDGQRIRAWRNRPPGFDRALWREMASQGWFAIAVPEAEGGLALGIEAAAIVAEQIGRACLPEPYVTAGLLGPMLLAQSTNEAARRELLPGVLSGETVLAPAWQPADGGISPSTPGVFARPDPDGFVLSGESRFVVPAKADVYLVLAREGDGLLVAAVDGRDARILREEPGPDGVSSAWLGFQDLRLPNSRLLMSGTAVADRVGAAFDHAVIVQSAEALRPHAARVGDDARLSPHAASVRRADRQLPGIAASRGRSLHPTGAGTACDRGRRSDRGGRRTRPRLVARGVEREGACRARGAADRDPGDSAPRRDRVHRRVRSRPLREPHRPVGRELRQRGRASSPICRRKRGDLNR